MNSIRFGVYCFLIYISFTFARTLPGTTETEPLFPTKNPDPNGSNTEVSPTGGTVPTGTGNAPTSQSTNGNGASSTNGRSLCEERDNYGLCKKTKTCEVFDDLDYLDFTPLLGRFRKFVVDETQESWLYGEDVVFMHIHEANQEYCIARYERPGAPLGSYAKIQCASLGISDTRNKQIFQTTKNCYTGDFIWQNFFDKYGQPTKIIPK
ncbi:unnamed protein product [Caenorhabditis angaria]|uniref:Uncharacterized protein n=1 Tax=Caenorhabditis angaria TaxID=860376 RepID=A0A9P1N8Z4_9PELO|nr:unnamed protein product [Caenorhabditis angaria]